MVKIHRTHGGRMKIPRKLSEENKTALFMQLHKEIETAAETMANSIDKGTPERDITYPPNAGFTKEEIEALQKMRSIPHIKSAIRKIIACGAASPIFQVLCILDTVGVPDFGTYTGVILVDDVDTDEDAYSSSLHDDFYESYWIWKKIRPTKQWSLDTSDIIPETAYRPTGLKCD